MLIRGCKECHKIMRNEKKKYHGRHKLCYFLVLSKWKMRLKALRFK